MTLKILMLKGLPASGKSSFAKVLAKQRAWVRVNFDDLRESLHPGLPWSRRREKIVQETAYLIAGFALSSNKSVIWDNTSFAPKHEQRLRELAKSYKADFEVKYFDITVEEAIKRDLKRANSVGPNVIRDMYYRYVWEQPDQEYRQDWWRLPAAVIFDVDGTLAHNDGHRGHYDWDKVGADKDHDATKALLDGLRATGHEIVIVTGRDGICEQQTRDWLEYFGIHYEGFFIRQAGDNRADHIVKKEIFEKNIKDNWAIRLVVDDREQVVRMWKDELGLAVFQARHPGQYHDF